MPHYLLSIYQPEGPPPARELLEPVIQTMNALIAEAKAAQVWVFNGGLHAPSAATVVRLAKGELMTTDGPYIEGKEHVGGFMIVHVPDLDAALTWASKMARALVLPGSSDGLPIEIKPFNYTDGAA